MAMRKKLFVCFLCETRYAELEEAEVCERSHGKQAMREREKHEDDGREYGHPDDYRRGID